MARHEDNRCTYELRWDEWPYTKRCINQAEKDKEFCAEHNERVVDIHRKPGSVHYDLRFDFEELAVIKALLMHPHPRFNENPKTLETIRKLKESILQLR